MKINMKQLKSSMILLAIILAYMFIIFNNSNRNMPYELMISFDLIAFISIWSILTDERNFSLYKLHWYFVLIFLFIAPISQYLSYASIWGYTLSNQEMLQGNVVILIWVFLFNIFYKLRLYAKGSGKNDVLIVETKSNIKSYKLLIISTIVFCTLIVLYGGLRGILTRDSSTNVNMSLGFVLAIFLRGITVLSVAVVILCRRKFNQRNRIVLILICCIAFIVNFPISQSRYWTGIVYLGLIICTGILSGKFDRKFDILLIIGLCAIFPMFSVFKHFTLAEVINGGKLSVSFSNVYNSVDFDAYTMICRTIIYVKDNGLCLGQQLRGVLLFWIPRHIWNVKGIASGELVSAAQGAAFTNLSCPLMAEGYIDFGYLGVAVYAIIFSRLCKMFDNKYWNTDKEMKVIRYIDIIYPFLIGFVIFVMRGALLPVVIRLFGFYLPLILFYIFEMLTKKMQKL